MIRWLDDIDTRVIGRGNPNRRTPTPDPWTPEMGPLSSARATLVPYAWALCTAGAVCVVAIVAFPGDHTTFVRLVQLAWLPLSWCATRGLRSFRLVDAAAPAPADVATERSGAAHWVLATVIGVVLSVSTLSAGVVHNDASRFYIPVAYLLAVGASMASQVRRLTGWEDEHGVDLLRARWRTGSRGYYTRSRAPATSAEAAGQP